MIPLVESPQGCSSKFPTLGGAEAIFWSWLWGRWRWRVEQVGDRDRFAAFSELDGQLPSGAPGGGRSRLHIAVVSPTFPAALEAALLDQAYPVLQRPAL